MINSILKRKNQPDIAYSWEKGNENLAVVYLHGWSAQRNSIKGNTLLKIAQKYKCHYLSLDYTAHGESGGEPSDFTVGQGIQDVWDVVQATVQKMPVILVGNSIGGWIGLYLAQQYEQVVGFLGLAPAPDITQYVWDKLLPDYVKSEIEKGHIFGPSPETMGFCFTQKLFQDGEKHFLLEKEIDFNGPVRMMLGDKDDRVDIQRLYKIKDRLTSKNVSITLMKGSNHHLSEQQDLQMMQTLLSGLIQEVL